MKKVAKISLLIGITFSTFAQKSQQLTGVFNDYFALKDALVKSDGKVASSKAGDLIKAISVVKMDSLDSNTHAVFMKVSKDLSFDAEHIADTKEVSHQRDHFMTLSKNMYELMKASKMEQPVYYQFCPMANKGKGANWLSKESAIKNPYYGSMMLSCGSTKATLK